MVLIPLLLVGAATGFAVKGQREAVLGKLEAEGYAAENLEQANALKEKEKLNQKIQVEVIETVKELVSQEGPDHEDSKLNEKIVQTVEKLAKIDKQVLEVSTVDPSDDKSNEAVAGDRAAQTTQSANPPDLAESDADTTHASVLEESPILPSGTEREANADSIYNEEIVPNTELANADNTSPLPVTQPQALTTLPEFATCSAVEQLEPKDCSNEFPPGKVWVYAKVKSPEAQSLTLLWTVEDGKRLRSRQLPVQPNLVSGYRTFDWKKFDRPGSYTVRLFDSEQKKLGQKSFTIKD